MGNKQRWRLSDCLPNFETYFERGFGQNKNHIERVPKEYQRLHEPYTIGHGKRK